jgi:Ca2+-binding RTX toxin-like protein
MVKQDDTLYGNDGDDDIVGGSGEDTIYGNAGNDTLTAASGHHPSDWDDDTLYCDDASNDSTYSNNVVYRHSGYDTINFCSNDSNISNDES